MTDTLIQTNLGPVRARDLVDKLTYLSYRAQREHGMTQVALFKLGFTDAVRYEELYQAEQEEWARQERNALENFTTDEDHDS